MNISKMLRVATTTAAFLFLTGCNDQCGSFTHYEFQVNATKIDTVGTPDTPNGTTAIKDENGSLSYHDFMIDLILHPETPAQNLSSKISFSLFNNAYACSPYIPFEIQLRKLEITSTSNFSSEYPAGTDLANFFYVDYFYSRYTTNTNNFYMYEIADLITQNVNEPERLQLRLKEKPTLSLSHTFTLKINGTPFILENVNFE